MKLWSLQLWTQFLQLCEEDWKIQDFNGVWTRDLLIPVRRSNQLSYEATDVGSWSFVGSNVPVRNEWTMKWHMKWIIYELRTWNHVKLWSSQIWMQFLQLRKEAWKIQDFNGVWTRDLVIPMRRSNQLSYEATDVGSWSFVGSNVPVRNEWTMKWYMKWIISELRIWNQVKLDLIMRLYETYRSFNHYRGMFYVSSLDHFCFVIKLLVFYLFCSVILICFCFY